MRIDEFNPVVPTTFTDADLTAFWSVGFDIPPLSPFTGPALGLIISATTRGISARGRLDAPLFGISQSGISAFMVPPSRNP